MVKVKQTKGSDPLNINERLYAQVGALLDDMEAADREERMTMPQRISALIAVGRIQKMFQDLRKGELGVGAGSAISRYAAAFAASDGASVGNSPAGSNIVQFDTGERDEDDERDFDA